MFISELKWIVPFICLGAIAGTTLRREPQAPTPVGSRVVTDDLGQQVHIALPFRGSVLTRGTEIPEYLEATLEPDTLLAVTDYWMGDRVRNHTIGRIFPEVVSNKRIWATAGISDAQGPKIEIERMLQFDPGVFMGWHTLAEPIERVGIPFVGFKDFPDGPSDLESGDRVFAEVVGKPERADAIAEKKQELYRHLDSELNLTDQIPRLRYLYMFSFLDNPEVLILGARNHYSRFFIPHAGVVNACSCPSYFERVDAEHVIADDPEIIVLASTPPYGELPGDFVKDPRWRGLTAVINRRVYEIPPGIDAFIDDAFWSRWLAELAHPDRLRPGSRELYRNYIKWLLNYDLSEEELDTAFDVKDNHGMANAERFESR